VLTYISRNAESGSNAVGIVLASAIWFDATNPNQAVSGFTAMNSAASLKSHVCFTNVSIIEVNSLLAAPKGEHHEFKSN
jgi:hypothetical protein